ncbi:hypothetical protein SXCC_00450 [Gluconacetobacter sp. SXCC-1]|nr:hypothetical protein SXCC_00450 [Gluconacetobacter sp. SXCC-1]
MMGLSLFRRIAIPVCPRSAGWKFAEYPAIQCAELGIINDSFDSYHI